MVATCRPVVAFFIASTGFCLIAAFEYADRPRGVSLVRMPLYDRQGKSKFSCFNGKLSIPFEFVNDDYCDCEDGSDEPGTAACVKGHFHCVNLGHKPSDLPSSRVNDGICDCCDGSDEWAGYGKCTNFCSEAGKEARLKAEIKFAIQKEGFGKKADLIKLGREAKLQNQKRIDELKLEKAPIGQIMQDLDAVKQAAEKLEKEAKDVHTERWNVELEEKNKVRRKEKATTAFEELDTNNDKRVTYDELKNRLEFDKNSDGSVAPDELDEYFGGNQEIQLEAFLGEIWNKISDIYKPTIGMSEESHSDPSTVPSADIPPPVETPPTMPPLVIPETTPKPFSVDHEEKLAEENDEQDDMRDDEVEDFEKKDATGRPIEEYMRRHRPQSDEPDDKMPDFDENTKKLIEEADKARKEFEEVERKNRAMDDEIRRLEDVLKMDFGPEDEFSHLYRQCFEYSDAQYTYGLCLFDRTYQKPKDGGHGDVGMGTWGSWNGPPENHYAKQLYKNGLTCWNGPARSTDVAFKCGSENKLISASEPGRCEYAMEFETPAACGQPPASPHEEHGEL